MFHPSFYVGPGIKKDKKTFESGSGMEKCLDPESGIKNPGPATLDPADMAEK
jgi:hypothetical protein